MGFSKESFLIRQRWKKDGTDFNFGIRESEESKVKFNLLIVEERFYEILIEGKNTLSRKD